MSNLTVEFNMVTRGLTWLSTTEESSCGMLVLPSARSLAVQYVAIQLERMT